MVYSLAVRFLRDRAVAEELSQDVFLRCYRQLHLLESEAHVTAWLRRAICHRCIDEARKRKLRPKVDLDAMPELAARSGDSDVFLHGRLRRMVAALPEKARMMLLMRYQEDLDPLEIAAVLEMPVSSVKSSLHRALTALRGKFARVEVAK